MNDVAVGTHVLPITERRRSNEALEAFRPQVPILVWHTFRTMSKRPLLLIMALAVCLSHGYAASEQQTPPVRRCSSSDFAACKTCTELAAVIDLSNPNAGDYYSGAEWNALYASYVLNCPILAARLLKAGANPSSGGTGGSMILSVSSKWPHNNKEINKAWAAILLLSGAHMDQKLNLRQERTTSELLKEETWFQPDYPDIFSLFQR